MKKKEIHWLPIDPLVAGLPGDVTIRHYPETKNDFLTFQIGRAGVRNEMKPTKNNNSTLIETGRLATMFVVIAYGTSLQRAKEMFFYRTKKEEQK